MTSAAAPALTRLPLPVRLGRAFFRHYPFARGRWRLSQIFLRNVSLPPSATFSFDHGTFVDTSLAEWPNGYRDLFLFGSIEGEELAAWKRILRPGDAVIDGGANYGYWTLVASRLVGPTGRVFSFEANPPTADRLQSNVAASAASNVVIERMALSDTQGSATINNAAHNPIGGHASLKPHTGWDWATSTDVPTTTADALAHRDDWPPIRLIKLDIEGAELPALRGMAGILARHRPFLTVEWNTAAAAGFGYHPKEIVSLLTGSGYTLCAPENGTLRPCGPPADTAVTMLWFAPSTDG